MTGGHMARTSKESNTNKDWLYWYENPSESASKIEQQEAEIERLRNLLCEICATHTDCRACKGILASKGVSNAHETISAPVDYQCRTCGSSDVIPWPTNSAPSVAGAQTTEPSNEGSGPATVGAGPPHIHIWNKSPMPGYPDWCACDASRPELKALAQPPGCGYPACGCADITQCEALKAGEQS